MSDNKQAFQRRYPVELRDRGVRMVLEEFERSGERQVFETMLWLNPSDQQGVRFEITAVQDGVPWKELS
jgi:hypothetical protein